MLIKLLIFLFSMALHDAVEAEEINLNILQDELNNYFKRQKIHDVVFLGCKLQDHFFWTKSLSSHGIRSNPFPIIYDFNFALKSIYARIGVVLDSNCEELTDTLMRGAKDRPEWFNNLHHWFIYPKTNDSRIFNRLRLDSQVRVAIYNEQESKVDFQETFRLGSKTYVNKRERNDFFNKTLNIGLVIIREKWDKTGGARVNKLTYNSVNEVGIGLCYLLGDLYNFHLNVTIYSNYGYIITNGSIDGVLGDIQKNTLDVATGTILKEFRWNFSYFTAPVVKFCPRFIFRRPPISATKNIYALAFDYDVWISILLMIILGAIILTITEFLGNQDDKFENQNGWFDYSFVALIILLLQGSDTSPQKNSSRVAFFFLLILAVLFDTCYSASIVVLLQSPNNFIKTLEDLFYSPFKMVFQESESNIRYINFTKDPMVKRLYYEKLFTRPWDKSFVGIDEGLSKVRSGEYAFHTNSEAYQKIAETFDESEKCALQELYMFPCELIYMSVVRDSQYLNYFKKGLVLLNEVGLRKRVERHWYPDIVKCPDQIQDFVSVSFQDIKPAFFLILCGFLASSLVFLIEISIERSNIKNKIQKFTRRTNRKKMQK